MRGKKYKGTYQILHAVGMRFFIQWSPKKYRPHSFADIGQADTISGCKEIMNRHEKNNRK